MQDLDKLQLSTGKDLEVSTPLLIKTLILETMCAWQHFRR